MVEPAGVHEQQQQEPSSSSSTGDTEDFRCSPASTIMIYVHDNREDSLVGRDISG